jgi:hypothetical protein
MDKKVAGRLTQLFLMMAAAVLVGRVPLADDANACSNCETKTKCQGGLATGFASCKVEYIEGKGDVCSADLEAPCPKVPEG